MIKITFVNAKTKNKPFHIVAKKTVRGKMKSVSWVSVKKIPVTKSVKTMICVLDTGTHQNVNVIMRNKKPHIVVLRRANEIKFAT